MSKRTLGTLADLAKILEEAADPTSAVREDRQIAKLKANAKKAEGQKSSRVMDPKRKAWYERRLREQVAPKPGAPFSPAPSDVPEPVPVSPEVTRAALSRVGDSLLQALADAKTNKPAATASKRPEAWRRKPGDPIF